MPEEFQQIKTELQTNAVPIVIGALAILLVAVGIYLFASRPKVATKPQPTPIAIETPIDLSGSQPKATSPLSGFASLTPTPSPTPKTAVKKLPKSGFPAAAVVLLSFGFLTAGIKFLKK